MLNKTTAIKLITVLAIGLLAGSIGHTLGARSVTEDVQQTQEEVSLTQETITTFLRAYYTFDNLGDNYEAFRPFLTKELSQKEQDKLAQATASTQPQQFGHAYFVGSRNYVQVIDTDTVEVLAFVTHTMDLLNNEGKIVTKGIENQVTLKLLYKKDQETENYLVSKLELITLTEGEI